MRWRLFVSVFAICLIGQGFWLAWPPLGYIVGGLLVYFEALPDPDWVRALERTHFCSCSNDDAERRP